MASKSPSMPTPPTNEPTMLLEQRSLSEITHHLARHWVITGLIASMVAVGVALLVSRTGANILSQVLVAVACGTLTAFALAPWKHVQAVVDRAALLERVATLIEDLQTGERSNSIRELAARQDEVGSLCQAVDDLLSTIVSQRVRTHSLKRTMHDTIRKETTRATAALMREAMTDSLTGLGNRRAFHQFTQRLHSIARSAPAARLGTMVIDVDDFKQLNDSVGHRQGDECLKFIGTVLAASIRREDCALRLGGDEFLVLMLDRSREEMKAVAERVISLVRQMPWPASAGQPPTLSIGLAEASVREFEALEEQIAAADAAMYRAKRIGGSGIGTAWEPAEQAESHPTDSSGPTNATAA